MRKVLLFGILTFVLVLGYFVLAPKTASQSVPALLKKSKPSSRKLFLGARKKTLKMVNTLNESVSDGCEETTSNLEKIDFNAPVREWVLNFDQEAFGKCHLDSLKDKIAAIQTYCFEKFDEKECSTHAVFLRAMLRTRGINDAEDHELVADLIIKEFADNKPDFKKLQKLSKKLMVLDPHQLSYQKLWASSKVVSQLISGKSLLEIAEQIQYGVNPELWNDPSMNSIKMAIATGLEPINLEQYARGYLAQKSDSTMHEVLGWALWKQNRQAEAISELNRAIALNPNDQWLKNQLKKVRAKGANENSYEARIMMGLNVQDIYN